jgi:hypothetical protein
MDAIPTATVTYFSRHEHLTTHTLKREAERRMRAMRYKISSVKYDSVAKTWVVKGFKIIKTIPEMAQMSVAKVEAKI